MRTWLYIASSVNFVSLAVGAADRARLLMVLGRLISAQQLGRAPGRMRPVWVTYRGRRLAVYVDRLNDLDVLWEVLGEKQYDELELPGAPDVILDLGAHVGAALLALHVRFPGARLVAVEADPNTLPRLQRTLAQIPGVQVVPAAITDRDGVVDFLPSREAWGSGLTEITAKFGDPNTEPATRVRGIRFETLLHELGLERADLVKVDIEGAEWQLVGDLPEQRVGTLIVEWHVDMHGHEPDEAAAVLVGHRVQATPMPTPGRYMVIARPAGGP